MKKPGHLRFTIWKIRRAELSGGGARATRNLKAVIGRSYKAAGTGRLAAPMILLAVGQGYNPF